MINRNINIKNSISSFIKVENLDNTLFEINENNNILKLKNTSNSKDNIIIECNKIFFNNNENSYLYEELIKNKSKMFFEGKDVSLLVYGIAKSGKKSTIIGNKDQLLSNINARGIVCRLIDSILDKIRCHNSKDCIYKLYHSIVGEYNNKVIDLNRYLIESNNNNLIIEKSKANECNKYFENILDKNSNFQYKTIQVDNIEDFVNTIANILTKYYNLNNNIDNFYDNTNYIITLQLFKYNKNSNNLVNEINLSVNNNNSYNKNNNLLSSFNFIIMSNSNTFNFKSKQKININNIDKIETISKDFKLSEKEKYKIKYNINFNNNKMELLDLLQLIIKEKENYINNMNNKEKESKLNTLNLNYLKSNKLLSNNKDIIKKFDDNVNLFKDNHNTYNNLNSNFIHLIRNCFNTDIEMIFLGTINLALDTFDTSKDTLLFIEKINYIIKLNNSLKINYDKYSINNLSVYNNQISIDNNCIYDVNSDNNSNINFYQSLVYDYDQALISKDKEIFDLNSLLKSLKEKNKSANLNNTELNNKYNNIKNLYNKTIEIIKKEFNYKYDLDSFVKLKLNDCNNSLNIKDNVFLLHTPEAIEADNIKNRNKQIEDLNIKLQKCNENNKELNKEIEILKNKLNIINNDNSLALEYSKKKSINKEITENNKINNKLSSIIETQKVEICNLTNLIDEYKTAINEKDNIILNLNSKQNCLKKLKNSKTIKDNYNVKAINNIYNKASIKNNYNSINQNSYNTKELFICKNIENNCSIVINITNNESFTIPSCYVRQNSNYNKLNAVLDYNNNNDLINKSNNEILYVINGLKNCIKSKERDVDLCKKKFIDFKKSNGIYNNNIQIELLCLLHSIIAIDYAIRFFINKNTKDNSSNHLINFIFRNLQDTIDSIIKENISNVKQPILFKYLMSLEGNFNVIDKKSINYNVCISKFIQKNYGISINSYKGILDILCHNGLIDKTHIKNYLNDCNNLLNKNIDTLYLDSVDYNYIQDNYTQDLLFNTFKNKFSKLLLLNVKKLKNIQDIHTLIETANSTNLNINKLINFSKKYNIKENVNDCNSNSINKISYNTNNKNLLDINNNNNLKQNKKKVTNPESKIDLNNKEAINKKTLNSFINKEMVFNDYYTSKKDMSILNNNLKYIRSSSCFTRNILSS